jgi:Protein of unknown function (DUF3052)
VGENSLDPTAHAGRDMDFIHLDRAGNWCALPLAGGKGGEQRQDEEETLRLEVQGSARLSISKEKSKGFPRIMAGYSGTPLARKLGIRPNERLIALNAPDNYKQLLNGLPEGVAITERIAVGAAFVHLFVRQRSDLAKQLATLRTKLDDAGILWVSWPKKAAKVETDIIEDTIREVALPLGFVDVKVCAVDETWSGLKLMVRRENRKVKK